MALKCRRLPSSGAMLTASPFLVPSSRQAQARLSYLALYSIRRRGQFSTSCRQQTTRSPSKHSDYHGQGYSNSYTPGEPIRGPFGELPVYEPPKITPTKLKAHLDEYVVGQDRPKKRLSTAVFNHYQRVWDRDRQAEHKRIAQERRERIMRAQEHSQRDPIELERSTSSWRSNDYTTPEPSPKKLWPLDIDQVEEPAMEKSNLLLLGPTGVGKSLMMKTLARDLDVPFSISDVTSMTQAGYIGQDVESCVERLLVAADYDVARAERGIIFLDEIDKLATSQSRVSATGRDVGGEGVQQALLKIIEGTTIQITPRSERSTSRGQSGSSGNFGAGFGASAGPSGSSQKPEVYSVRTDNILFFLAGAFVGLDKIILNRISRGSLGFGANIAPRPRTEDTSSSNSATRIPSDLYRQHAHRYLSESDLQALQQSEGLNVLDLVTPVDLKTYGFIPEFIGRVPIHVPLSALSLDSMVRILSEPKNSLIAQYSALFKTYGVDLHFTTPALHAIAAEAQQMGTGARALRTVVEGVLEDSMHHAPDSGIRYVLIDEAVAKKETPPAWFTRSQVMRFKRAIDEEEQSWAAKRMREDARAQAQAQAQGAGSFEQYRESFKSGL